MTTATSHGIEVKSLFVSDVRVMLVLNFKHVLLFKLVHSILIPFALEFTSSILSWLNLDGILRLSVLVRYEWTT